MKKPEQKRKKEKSAILSKKPEKKRPEEEREERATKRKTTSKVTVSSKRKKAAPTPIVESSDEELAFDLEESDEESVSEETEDVPLPLTKENITENTHVLVRSETGKQSVYYAGCVQKCDADSCELHAEGWQCLRLS